MRHSQNMTVAARATAESKTLGHLSWRVATRRQAERKPIDRSNDVIPNCIHRQGMMNGKGSSLIRKFSLDFLKKFLFFGI